MNHPMQLNKKCCCLSITLRDRQSLISPSCSVNKVKLKARKIFNETFDEVNISDSLVLVTPFSFSLISQGKTALTLFPLVVM